MQDPNKRISDVERDQATQALGVHYAQGRLDLDEFEQRVETAQQAKNIAQLDELFNDLPLPSYDSQIEPYQGAQPLPPAHVQSTSGKTVLAGLTKKQVEKLMELLWGVTGVWIGIGAVLAYAVLGLSSFWALPIMFGPMILVGILSVVFEAMDIIYGDDEPDEPDTGKETAT